MPDMEVQELNQKAVFWPAPTYDNYGDPVIGPGTEIWVRWVGKSSGGQSANANAVGVTITVIVDRVMPVGSLIWKGRFGDMPTLAFVPDSGVMQVTAYNETTDIRGRSVRRSVQASRFKSTLPI